MMRSRKVAEEIVAADIDPLKVIQEGISAGANVVSDKFENEEYFLPELMLAGEAMQGASEVLMGGLSKEKKDEMDAEDVVPEVVDLKAVDLQHLG